MYMAMAHAKRAHHHEIFEVRGPLPADVRKILLGDRARFDFTVCRATAQGVLRLHAQHGRMGDARTAVIDELRLACGGRYSDAVWVEDSDGCVLYGIDASGNSNTPLSNLTSVRDWHVANLGYHGHSASRPEPR